MKVLVLGGSGFIGYHIINQCLANGLEVGSVDLGPSKIMPENVSSHFINVNESDDNTLITLFDSYDVIIDTLGADDRVVPDRPAYTFFHKANVEDTERLIRLSKQAGIKRFIVLSSYFCHINDLYPELKLTEVHPYIRSRCKQAEVALASASDEFAVNVLMLPFVFGVTPGNKPLWYQIVLSLKYLSYFPMGFMQGGTNAVSVKTVAKAIAAAAESGATRKAYLIGGQNIYWPDLMMLVAKAFDREPKLYPLDKVDYSFVTKIFHTIDELHGKEGGLNKTKVNDLLTHELFFDPSIASLELGYEIDPIEDAVNETVAYCEELSHESIKGIFDKWLPFATHGSSTKPVKSN